MNDLLEKKPAAAVDSRTGEGSAPAKPVAPTAPANGTGNVAAPADAKGNVAQPGKTPPVRANQFVHAVNTPEGQKERREADAERKRLRRQTSAEMATPPPLPPAVTNLGGASPAPGGESAPGTAVPAVSDFIAWTPEDVSDFTDELIELSEAKRIDQFVAVAKEAKLPPKLVAEIEKSARYPVTCKSGLKRAVAGVIAKWLNKSGISAKNKEEAALLFCIITIKVQGFRVKRNLHAMIEDDAKKQKPEDGGQKSENKTP